MKRIIKSYASFSSRCYRIVALMVIPLLFISFTVFLTYVGFPIGLEFVVINVLAMWLVLEDNWTFGGIFHKDSGCLEYIKSSKQALWMMKMAFGINFLQKLLRFFVLSLGFSLYSHTRNQIGIDAREVAYLLTIILMGYVGILICCNLVCYLNHILQVYLCSLLASLICSGIVLLVFKLTKLFPTIAEWVCLGISIILTVVVYFLSLWHVKKRVGDSYYD